MWTSFHDEFRSMYHWAAHRGKPILIGETGAMEYPGMPNRKATWIPHMGTTLRTHYPKVKAVMWFDRVGGSNQGSASFDWRLNTSTAAKSAWVALGRRPW